MDELLKVKNGYGSDTDLEIISSDPNHGTLTLKLIVDDHHLNESGTLDEGLVATLADNYTTYLLIAHSLATKPDTMPISVSVCLSVQALAPVSPGTIIHLVCRIGNDRLTKPHAFAVFVDAKNPNVVYARASHTKHNKDVMGYGAQKSGKL
ncbi:Acyl-coenzyme A thioesterase 13 [Coemansia sp. RSA 485]|nr:Acyl-coenzyme A thioesterase 13 [Coemansia sp. RSA 485]